METNTTSAGDTKQRSEWFRFGFLALILALFACHATDLPVSRHYWRGFIVPLMLLLSHLAFQFRWPPRVSTLFRAAAIIWTIVGGILFFIP